MAFDSAFLIAFPPEFLVLVIGLCLVGGLVAGMGGPGGILLMVTLFSLISLPPDEVAGTSSTIFVVASAVGTVVYASSGDIDWRLGAFLGTSAVIGVPLGVRINAHLTQGTFTVLLAGLLFTLGTNLLYREFYDLEPIAKISTDTRRGQGIIAGTGFSVGVVSGASGFGGGGLAIPILVTLGVPVAIAIGSGLLLGTFITAAASVNYLHQDSVVSRFVALLGIPFLIGLVAGWIIVHRIDPDRLTAALGAVVLVFGVYVLLFG